MSTPHEGRLTERLRVTVAKEADSVCVVGLGACTSVGASAASSAASVRGGICAFAEHPHMIDTAGNPMIVANASYLPDELVGADRFLHLGMRAAQEALNAFNVLLERALPVPIIIGLPAPRPGLPRELNQLVSEEFKAMAAKNFAATTVEVIETGHSAGLMALEAGSRKIRQGLTEFCLIGGADSYMDPETLEWLEECDQLHSAGEMNNAWGFIPGEAAGFCLLASHKTLKKYQVQGLAGITATATAREKNLIKTKTICLGEGLTAAFRQVLQDIPLSGTKISTIICDMNGEPYRAEEYGFTAVRVSEYFDAVDDFLAPADCWGDVGAASGPLYVMLAAAGWKRRYAKGPNALIWTSSEGGERSAALLTAS